MLRCACRPPTFSLNRLVSTNKNRPIANRISHLDSNMKSGAAGVGPNGGHPNSGSKVASMIEVAEASAPRVPTLLKIAFPSDHDEDGGSSDTELFLSKYDLVDGDFPSTLRLPLHLQHVNLSRNLFREIPRPILELRNLITLDVSRNSLRSLPPEISQLTNLQELNALSNNLRARLLPLPELASLSKLRVIDLRYNSKLKRAALEKLEEALKRPAHLPPVEIRGTIPNTSPSAAAANKKYSACDRDATVLRSQLEPLSTPQLRKRLDRTFDVPLDDCDENAFDREFVMTRLLEAYERRGPCRQVRYEQGIPVRQERLDALLQELEAIPWPITTRERPKIRAEYYMILQKPGSGQSDSVRTQRESAKLERYRELFDLAVATIQELDPIFAERFTALAVTKNFTGSPHIDTLNVGPFYGIALGDFEEGGGKIAVECSPLLVAEVDTRGKFGKVDGRFPHWVTPYSSKGTRYSLIYYQTYGSAEPQTTAIFAPPSGVGMDEKPWIPPPVYDA